MPSTYSVARVSDFLRETSLPRAPNTPRTIGIIGYTHGVSEAPMPAVKAVP